MCGDRPDTRRWALVAVVLGMLLSAAGADDTQPMAGPLRLVLPPVIYAVPGIETNLYFDNVVLAPNTANYVFDVICPVGAQQQDRWTFTPTAEKVGRYALVLEVRDDQNQLIARGASTLVVSPADSGGGRKVRWLFIGDSLTAASVYPARVVELCQGEANPVLTLIGSHTPRGNDIRHEGYGGWTAERFVTHYREIARTGDPKQRGSPFLYQGPDARPQLDFVRYLQDVGDGEPPDVVTIFLGPNDVFRDTDQTIDAAIDNMLRHYEQLVQMVHVAHPQTLIGVMLAVPPAATQDAFGANYGSSQTRWQYRRNQHRLVERMLEAFGNREARHIYLVPTVVSLDCLNGYAATVGPANAHSSVEVRRLNNGVHPDASGYRQIGDALYAWFKARMPPP